VREEEKCNSDRAYQHETKANQADQESGEREAEKVEARTQLTISLTLTHSSLTHSLTLTQYSLSLTHSHTQNNNNNHKGRGDQRERGKEKSQQVRSYATKQRKTQQSKTHLAVGLSLSLCLSATQCNTTTTNLILDRERQHRTASREAQQRSTAGKVCWEVIFHLHQTVEDARAEHNTIRLEEVVERRKIGSAYRSQERRRVVSRRERKSGAGNSSQSKWLPARSVRRGR
jgi:hypothetical protein